MNGSKNDRRNDAPSSELTEKFEGRNVSVHLVNGAHLEGKAHFAGNWLNLPNERRGKEALCNLSHTISIVRNDA